MNQSINSNIDPEGIIKQYAVEHHLGESFCHTAHKWFSPLAQRISAHHHEAKKPILVGINGCQGSGKSTLTGLLVELLNNVYAKTAMGCSIDDFYLSKQSRNELAKSQHPLLATRGVPGTHDTELLKEVISNLLRSNISTDWRDISVPKFNKSIDDLYPKNQWSIISKPVDIIILEGWCVGTPAQSDIDLHEPVNDFEKTNDKTGAWRSYCNAMLATKYKEVFNKINYLIMLKAPSFEQVYSWRLEQEHKLIASLKQQTSESLVKKQPIATMSDQEIKNFIQFYQRLTEHSLTSIPSKCDSIFYLDNTRSITQCQQS